MAPDLVRSTTAAVSRAAITRHATRTAERRATTSEATATGNAASSVERLASGPTHEELERRAYQLFEERGREPGHEWEDWFRAEREP